MTAEPETQPKDELDAEELEDETAEALPDREALSTVSHGGPLGGPMPLP